jgi:predicted methyltransferase
MITAKSRSMWGPMAALVMGACLAAAATAAGTAGANGHQAVVSAVLSPARPADDIARDIFRKPADLLVFARVAPGQKVGELLPGTGYFSRVLAGTVGDGGKIYAWLPAAASPASVARYAVPRDPAYANVRLVQSEVFSAPEPLDLVWTTQNYHDLHHNGRNAEAMNAAVFAALKPGGLYFVSDHAARTGSGTADTDSMHRIDPEAVKAEVAKAGFKLVGESKVLASDADNHTLSVFKIHDRTDQFALLFIKPAK